MTIERILDPEAGNHPLDILVEECAEVIHSVCKIARFGIRHVWPRKGVENRIALSEELGDLQGMIDWLRECHLDAEGKVPLIDEASFAVMRDTKKQRVIDAREKARMEPEI